MKYDTYSFGCLCCGNFTSLQRKACFRHKKFHRKKLYCYTCKNTVNHIECKTDNEKKEFLTNFTSGEYEKEAKESLMNTQVEDIWRLLKA